MRMEFAVGLLAFICMGTAAADPWGRYENKDEMRGTVSRGAAMKVASTEDKTTFLTLHVLEEGGTAQGVVFQLEGEKTLCEQRICDFDVRFGEGSVHKESVSVDPDGRTFVPTSSPAFAGAVGLVKEFFIEVPTRSGSSEQFKFVIDEPAFPRRKSPSFTFAGVDLGGSASELQGDFRKVDSSSKLDCRESRNVAGAVPGTKIKSARVCFYRDMLYLVFLESSGKAESDAISKWITSKFGSSDPGGAYKKWPASNGKVVDLNTATASFWPDSKVKGAGRFMISDETLHSLVTD